jgi:hypothetical protein
MVEMQGRWHALVVVEKVVVGEGQVEALNGRRLTWSTYAREVKGREVYVRCLHLHQPFDIHQMSDNIAQAVEAGRIIRTEICT